MTDTPDDKPNVTPQPESTPEPDASSHVEESPRSRVRRWDEETVLDEEGVLLQVDSPPAQQPVRTSVWILGLALIVAVYAALAYLRNNDYKSELAIWDDAVRKSPNAWRPRQNRGAVLVGLGDLDGAMADFERALEIEPDNAVTLCHMGVVWERRGNADKAIECYKKAIESEKEYVVPLFNLGNVYLNQGKFEEAIAMFTAAIEIEPGSWQAISNRGFCQLMLRNLEAAAADAKLCEELEAPPPWAPLLKTPDQLPPLPKEGTGEGAPGDQSPAGEGTAPAAGDGPPPPPPPPPAAGAASAASAVVPPPPPPPPVGEPAED